MSHRRWEIQGSLALVANVVFWAATPVLLKELTQHVDSWTANGLRYPLAAVFYWPVLLRALLRGQITGALLARTAVPAFFSLGGQIFWALSPYYLPATLVGFLIKVSLVWALAAAMLLFPEERGLLRSRKFHAGLLLAVLGFVTLAMARGAFREETTFVGVLIILSCSLFFGLYGVSVRYFLYHVNPILSFGLIAQFVSLGSLVLMACFGDFGVVGSMEANGWALVILSSCIGIGVSHVLYYTAILRLGATITMAMHLLGPFVTLALASIFLDEAMGGLEWGAGIVLVGGGALLLTAQESLGSPRGDRDRSAPVRASRTRPVA